MSIILDSVYKKYGQFLAVDDISLEIQTGELLALLGPSGSGKTSLLRIIAGLEAPDRGEVRLQGDNVVEMSARERRVGFVFQHYALFPHMTVAQNIAFGLTVQPKDRRLSDHDIDRKVADLLALVQLNNLSDRYPTQLSGGQKQRVALARALAISPQVLLLDEPFGALDAKVRKELRGWLRSLQKDLKITTVFVTHDVDEALEVADRIAVIHSGKLAQIGTPSEVYHHPNSPFVYRFLGSVNVFPAQVDGHEVHHVRPHMLDLHLEMPVGVDAFLGVIIAIQPFFGPIIRVDLKLETGQVVVVDLPHDRFRELNLSLDQHVYITIKSSQKFIGDYSI